jgi:hypothetical protein
MAALIRSYKKHPNALVRTMYASSDEGPGYEDWTVRHLVVNQLSDLRFEHCAPDAQRRLRGLL